MMSQRLAKKTVYSIQNKLRQDGAHPRLWIVTLYITAIRVFEKNDKRLDLVNNLQNPYLKNNFCVSYAYKNQRNIFSAHMPELFKPCNKDEPFNIMDKLSAYIEEALWEGRVSRQHKLDR